MQASTPHYHDALLELANLRIRDERMRRASDALAEALQQLIDEENSERMPQITIERLASAMGVSCAAICACDQEQALAQTHECKGNSDFQALIAEPVLLAYLAQKPVRMVSDMAQLAQALDVRLPAHALPRALLSGLVQFEHRCWLVVCTGNQSLLERPEVLSLFKRFLPIVAHGLKRYIEGRHTEELAQREHAMQMAKEKAEAASRAKSEFVSRMSHELRTPMNVILGFTHLLQEEPLSHSQRNYVQLINNASEHLLDLINKVLDHAKIETGKLTLEAIPFDLPALIESVAPLIHPQASSKGLAFEVVVAPQLPRHILGDPTRIRQILLNLLANALKFTEHGTISLMVTAEAEQLHIRVVDTGIGMDEHVRSSLFKAFSQADESIARRFGGTGLGLLIARDLLLAMGGHIDVDSTPGLGTSFSLRLPCIRVQAPPKTGTVDKPGTALETHVPPASTALSGRRVLVVDDNSINLQLATALLVRLGMVVDAAQNGQDALSRIFATDYDLVLMDMEMPEMDAVMATQQLRLREAKEARPRLPVVALTANAMAEDRLRCMAAGMDGYLAKPISVSLLRAELERLLPASD